MTAGVLPDSSSVAPLYHNIDKGKLLICWIDRVKRDHDRNYWYYKYFPISCDFCIEFRSFTTKQFFTYIA